MYDESLLKIKELLKAHVDGLTLSQVANQTTIHRNSASKYLDVLLTAGQVKMRTIGRAKLYTLNDSLPLSEYMELSPSYTFLVVKGIIVQRSNNVLVLVGKEVKGKKLSSIKELQPFILDKDVTLGRKDYMVRVVSVTLESGSQGEMFIIDDVTTEKKHEKQLQLMSRAVESSASGIVIADMTRKDQPLVYVNPAFEKLTGYSKREVLGKNCRFLQGKNTDKLTKKEIHDTIASGKEGRFELLNYKKNGETFYNELFLAPVKNTKTGEITHYVGVQSDVSWRCEN